MSEPLTFSSTDAGGLSVSLDGVANDGVNCPQQCEGDNFEQSVKNLAGSKYRDHLTGGGAANVIVGRAGNDVLLAAGGDDQMRAVRATIRSPPAPATTPWTGETTPTPAAARAGPTPP